MGSVRRVGWLGALLFLTGCGAGNRGVFNDFFAGGTSPGSVFAQTQPGHLAGVVLRRQSDQRILILANVSEATTPVTPVAGATIAVSRQGRSTVTGADGTYALRDLAPGILQVTVTLPQALGGVSASFEVVVQPGQTVAGLPLTPTF